MNAARSTETVTSQPGSQLSVRPAGGGRQNLPRAAPHSLDWGGGGRGGAGEQGHPLSVQGDTAHTQAKTVLVSGFPPTYRSLPTHVLA